MNHETGSHARLLRVSSSLDPAYTAAYIHRSFAFRSIGDFDRAIADMETALRLSPALVWPRKELLELQMASKSQVRRTRILISDALSGTSIGNSAC